MALADIVQTGLRIDHDSLFIRRARRQPVAAILQHENMAAQLALKNLRNGKAVANVAGVAMKHEDRHIACMLLVGADEEGAE